MAGYDGSSAAKEMVKQVQTAVIAHCENLKYRFAILDTPPGLNAQQAKEWRNYVNFDSAYAAMYYPGSKSPTSATARKPANSSRPAATWSASTTAQTASAASTKPRPTKLSSAQPTWKSPSPRASKTP